MAISLKRLIGHDEVPIAPVKHKCTDSQQNSTRITSSLVCRDHRDFQYHCRISFAKLSICKVVIENKVHCHSSSKAHIQVTGLHFCIWQASLQVDSALRHVRPVLSMTIRSGHNLLQRLSDNGEACVWFTFLVVVVVVYLFIVFIVLVIIVLIVIVFVRIRRVLVVFHAC